MIGDILRVLVYLALAGSLGIYVWRLYRHVVHHETRHDRAEQRRAAAAAAAGQPPPAPRSDTPGPEPTTAVERPPKPSRRDRSRAAKEAAPAVEDGALVRDVIRQELAKKQAAEGGAVALGPTAGTGAAPDGSGPDGSGTDGSGASAGRTGMFAKPQLPVAELLSGIALPCDLAPLVDRTELDPTRAVFATSGHSPMAVAGALADELERLGFRIDTVGDREAVARKPEGDLHITIHDDLTAFPSAPRSGVVVELRS